MTAIADFEQRWRQRGQTEDCNFKVNQRRCVVGFC